MRTAWLAASLFSTGFLAHWLLWRIGIPRRQTAVLLAIFFGVLAAWMIAWWAVPDSLIAPRTRWEGLHVCVFHTSLSLAYIVAYSAIENRSPSMNVLTSVADAGPLGRTHGEIRALLEREMPVETRLDAMVRDAMIVEDGAGYRLASKGRAWAAALSCWRRLLGMPRGG